MTRSTPVAHARLLGLATLLVLPSLAHATDVMGNLNVDTHWSLAASPYRLTGDLTIAPQATLTIDPGVVVEAAPTDAMASGTNTARVEFVVQGALIANGTAAQPIILRGQSAGADAWYGLSFEPGARASSVTFAQLSDATYALYVRSTNTVTLADLTVARSAVGLYWHSTAAAQVARASFDTFTQNGVLLESDGSGTMTAQLTDCTVRRAAAAGVRVTNLVSATVRRSQLAFNAVGLLAETGANLTLLNDVVFGNTQKGLDLSQGAGNSLSVINCTIDANVLAPWSAGSAGLGVHVRAVTSAGTFILRNDIITNHGTAGLRVDGALAPAHDHNDVWQNGANYVGTTAGSGSVSINPLFTQNLSPDATWNFVAAPLSVTMANNCTAATCQWNYAQPGAATMRMRFTSLSIETNFDHLYGFDGAGAQVANYTGASGATTSATANGNTFRLAATSDSSGTSYFVVAGYEYQLFASNYRLQASSPLIDKGNDLGAPTEDLDTVTRPYDGDFNGTATTDLGAYEWHQNAPPFASAGPDQTVLPGTTVNFSAAGSRDPDGTIASYDWNFGDGSAHASTAATTHAYAAAGTYTATLTVIDDQGVLATDTCIITVATNLPPVANAGLDQFVAVGATVTFQGGASSDPDGTVVGYAWAFGDGTPAGSGATVTHAYATGGVYTVTLTVTDNRGATAQDTAAVVVGSGGPVNARPVAVAGGPYTVGAGQALQLSGAASSDSDGTIAGWAWNFGDGATGTGATPSHTWAAAGTYLLKLTVTDNGGATADDSTLVTVTSAANQPPVARAGGNRQGQVGQVLTFDGGTSTDADGTIAGWDWDFGDGSAHATTATATHAWASAGTWLVRLTVTDNRGATAQDYAAVSIAAAANQAPLARAGGSRQGAVGQAIAFDGTASSDPDGTIASWDWDFGDGSAHATTATATHAWASAGTWLVRLTVTDNRGATAQDLAVATVSAPGNTLPVARAGGNRAGIIGEVLAFDGGTSTDADGTIASWDWDFGDGAAHATTAAASHAFTSSGTFLVRLTVTDNLGGVGQDVALVTIHAAAQNQPPVANAGGSHQGAVGAAISFDGSASRDPDGSIATWDWDFGDGSTHATTATTTHTWSTAGVFVVRLTVGDAQGATASDVAVVTITAPVNQAPVAHVVGSASAQVGVDVSFDGSTSADADGTVTAWAWDFGDGATASGATATHAWAKPGAYLVRLKVTDDRGAVSQDVAVISITAVQVAASGCAVGLGGPSGVPGLLAVGVLLFLARRRR